jgi:hypothetical protein
MLIATVASEAGRFILAISRAFVDGLDGSRSKFGTAGSHLFYIDHVAVRTHATSSGLH